MFWQKRSMRGVWLLYQISEELPCGTNVMCGLRRQKAHIESTCLSYREEFVFYKLSNSSSHYIFHRCFVLSTVLGDGDIGPCSH